MNKRIKNYLLGYSFGLWIIAYACASNAQGIDLQQVVRDTQISRQDGQRLNMVWYIPTEYWAESFKKNSMLGERQLQDLTAAVDQYLIVAAIEGTLGVLGVLSSTPKEELEKKVSIVADGVTLKPIPEAELPAGTRAFIQTMKPAVSNMLGPMGSGLHFMVFNGKDANGKRVADPTKDGRLTFKMSEQDYSFRLPIGSLLPAKFDAQSGDRFPGDYIYNPYTGKKLTTSK